MQHAKKFVLVDPKMYRQTMPEKSLCTLDEEIEKTLNSDLPDDEKVKQYVSTLRKFKVYENPKTVEPKTISEPDLLESLPPNQQYKAKRLLRLIKDNPDLEWSDDGELIYRQKLMRDSHVTDLFGDALAVKKQKERPKAWEEFNDILESSKVPQSLVKRTKNRRQWISD